MPKQTPQRRIDNRTAVRSTSISGITLSAPAPTAVPLAAAGGGLAWDGGVLSVGAGAGITVNADDIALTTPGSLSASTSNSAAGSHTHSIDSTIARSAITFTAGAGLTGGGDLTASRTFAVGAGAGITVNADDIALTTPGSLSASTSNSAAGSHTHSIDSTIARSAITFTAGAGLTGGGDLTASRTFAVGAGAGITVNADDVALTTPGSLSASTSNSAAGSHTHQITANVAAAGLSVSTSNAVGTNASLARADHVHAIATSSNPGANAAILASSAAGHLTLVRLDATERLRSPRVDTNSGNLTIAPISGDVLLSPGNLRTLLAANTALQSDGYASQATGMRITATGEGDFRYLYADELHAKSFIADLEQALAGGQIITKSVAVVAASFTLPTAATSPTAWQTTFLVRDLPSAPNMAVFENGDWVAFRQFSRAGGQLTIGWAWGTVSGYVDQADGTQRWTWLRSSTTPGAATGTIPADSLALDFGVSGNGYHEINAIDGLRAINSPYSRIATWATHPSNITVRTQIGNLRGLFSINNEFGLYAGDGTSTANSYLRLSSAANEFRNLTTEWYASATKIIQIDPTYGIDLRSLSQSSGSSAAAAAAGYKITFSKNPGSGVSTDEVGYLIGTHDSGYSRLNLGARSFANMEASLRLEASSGGYSPSLTLLANGAGTGIVAVESASLGVGNKNPSALIDAAQISTRGGTGNTNIGFVGMNRGSSAATGYIDWRRPDTITRIAYLGWNDGGANNLGLNLENGADFNINGGNVGIGTTNPGAKLSIKGATSSSGETLVLSNSNNTRLFTYRDDGVNYFNNGQYLSPDGNSYARWWTPGVALGAINYIGTYGHAFTYNVKLDSGVWKSIGGGYGLAFAFSEGNFTLANTNVLSGANQNITWFDRLVVNTNGNVGIGAVSPAYKLDVNGSIRGTSLEITGAGGQVVLYDRDGSGAWVLYNQSDVFRLYNGTTDRLQLSNNGTLTLFNTLDVTGNITTRGASAGLSLVNRSDSSRTWTIHAANAGSITYPSYLWIAHNGTTVMSIGADGNTDIDSSLSVNSLSVGSTAGSLGSWTNVSFGSGWGNFSAGYQTCQYRRFGDVVMLRGLAVLNSGTAVVITTLPAGYRPTAGRLIFITAAGNAAGWTRIDVLADGTVQAVGGGTSFSYCSLDPIVFSIS